MEIWDAYKKNGEAAGCDLHRDQPIPQGLYHMVSETLVRHPDGSYLLIQRDWNKKAYPGYWGIGAGRSVLKGESTYKGAVRKL